jgi:hypothetical protein
MKGFMWRVLIGSFFVLLGILSAGCNLDTRKPTELPLMTISPLAPFILDPETNNSTDAADKAQSSNITTPERPDEMEQAARAGDEYSLSEAGDTDVLEPDYRVQFIEEDDILNVRSGPGVSYPIVDAYPLGTTGFKVTGPGQMVGNSRWLPIQHNELTGWVNSRFLVEAVSPQEFCADGDSKQIIDNLIEAIESRDSLLMAELVGDGRSLRIRRNWWNPEANLDSDIIPEIFFSMQSYHWGVADGSGQAIEGTFNAIIKPLLDKNLLGASEIGCGTILHGGTAGLVQLPVEYEGINFYSLYRPAGANEFELEWGTWVVGIETWQGVYRLSFLVHYEWEI